MRLHEHMETPNWNLVPRHDAVSITVVFDRGAGFHKIPDGRPYRFPKVFRQEEPFT